MCPVLSARKVTKQIVSYLVHWPLALLFLYSGGAKLLRLPQFAESVGDFGIVLDGLVRPTAIIVCIAELGLGYVLWQRKSWSLLATAALLLSFIGVLAYGVAIGLDIECGCFGSGLKFKLGQQLGIDLILLVWCLSSHWYLNARQGKQR